MSRVSLLHAGLKWDFRTDSVQLHNLKHTSLSEFHQALRLSAGALRRLRVSVARRLFTCRAASLLSSVSSHDRPPKRGLPRPNCHSHWFTSHSDKLLPHLPSATAESQQPTGKPEHLCWLYLWGMVGVELPARNKGISGTLPTMQAAGATHRQGVG